LGASGKVSGKVRKERQHLSCGVPTHFSINWLWYSERPWAARSQ